MDSLLQQAIEAECDIGFDFLPVTEALRVIDADMLDIIELFWQEDAALCIGGGFVAFALGLTDFYSDIGMFYSFKKTLAETKNHHSDIFLHPHHFPVLTDRCNERNFEMIRKVIYNEDRIRSKSKIRIREF